MAELDYLEALRNEFEEKRLLGEGFSEYVRGLGEHLSAGLEVTDSRVFWGGDAEGEIERLRHSFLVTPSRREIHGDEGGAPPGTRRAPAAANGAGLPALSSDRRGTRLSGQRGPTRDRG